MSIRFEQEDRLAILTIDRPEKLNAMTGEMYDEISALLRRIDEDEDIWAGIVTGEGGKAFSAGADLVDVHGRTGHGTPSWQPARSWRFDQGLEVSKPLIAAIEGYCLAGGLELALVCDIRIASATAQFGTPEVKWNLLHGFGAQILPSVVGLSNALYLLLTGGFIDAGEAYRLGLVQEVVEQGKALTHARETARKILANAPMAVRMTKELVLRSRDLPIREGLRLYHSFGRVIEASEDLEEGTRAFAERRPPRFTGR